MQAWLPKDYSRHPGPELRMRTGRTSNSRLIEAHLHKCPQGCPRLHNDGTCEEREVEVLLEFLQGSQAGHEDLPE